jgi:hypothetical protein
MAHSVNGFEGRIAEIADLVRCSNGMISGPDVDAALTIQRAYRAKVYATRYAVSFLARNPLIRIAAVSIQSTWRGFATGFATGPTRKRKRVLDSDKGPTPSHSHKILKRTHE